MSSAVPVYPSFELSLTDVLDFHNEHNPDFPAFVYIEDGANKATEISFREYVRAIHRVGKAVLGNRTPSHEVVAVIAQVDTIVYPTLILGLLKAGITPFPISPRNSPVAIVRLMQNTSAHRLLTTRQTLHDLIQSVEFEFQSTDPSFPFIVEEVPPLQEIFPKLGKESLEDPFTPLPSYVSSDTDIGMFLHSSGSTGLPKAIPLTFASLKDYAASTGIQAYRDYSVTRQGVMALPSFHMLGTHMQILFALYTPVSNVVYPPAVLHPGALPVMPSPDNVISYLQRTHCDVLISVPTYLQIWASSPETIEILSTLKAVIYAGGPLSPQTGDYLVSQGVHLRSLYGGTEFGVPTVLNLDPSVDKDWRYLHLSDRVKPRWVPQGDGTFELHFLSCNTHHMGVENLPDVKGYATLDIFEPHPTNPSQWKIVGRADDVLIHSSGEKTVPGPMEAIINSSSLIQGAIMFGRQRDQAGILIEPVSEYKVDTNDPVHVSEFRNKIWAIVEEANKIAPTFSRIFKEMILITSVDKPLPRVAKGTLSRKAAIKLYEEEINKLYETIESHSGGETVIPPRSWSTSDLREWLLVQTTDILSESGTALSSSSRDIFEQGFDSLSATILRLRVTSALSKAEDPTVRAVAQHFTQMTIYSHSTIDSLTAFILSSISGEDASKDHAEAIEEMIEKYSQGLDAPLPTINGFNLIEESNKTVVLLTGSTGNLGAQLLESLLRNDSVAQVYTLNRPSNRISMLERHKERFEDKALDVDLLSSKKLVYLEGDSAQPNLGLSDEIISELRDRLTMIIHNAWRLDFNLFLPSFEPNVRGSRNLIDLARSSRHASSIRYLFTSSIASAQSWDETKGPYPEELMMNAKYAVGGGYGESKYAVERILARSGLKASSFRIGQISGGKPNGAWAITDWVPIIVKSSVALDMLPNAHGVVSWAPMDAVSDAILEVGSVKEGLPFAVNVVHPRPVPWLSVITAVRKILIREKGLADNALQLVSFQEWFSEVEKRASDTSEKNAQEVPAVKLVEFFRKVSSIDEAIGRSSEVATTESIGLKTLSTANVERLSPRMKSLEQLDEHHVEQWIKYWMQVGL